MCGDAAVVVTLALPVSAWRKGVPMRDDTTPTAGGLLGQGEPGRPAVGRGPNVGGEFSQEDYHHPAAGWGAARSVAKVFVGSRELIAGTRAIQRLNHENGGCGSPPCAPPPSTPTPHPPTPHAP